MTATSSAPVALNRAFEPLFRITAGGQEPPTRYFLITGGRAGSKSFTTATWVGDALCRMRDWRVLFTRYTMVSAELSIIPEFSEKLDLLNVSHQFRITKNHVENLNTGSDVIFSGVKTSSGNQTAKLKSIAGVNVLVIEEGEEFESEEDFDKIDESIRRNDAPNLIIILMNPPTSDHWIYKRWIEKSHRYLDVDGCQIPVSTHPNVTHIHTTFMDAWEHLSDSYKNKIRYLRKHNLEKYQYRFLGRWRTQAEGAIFTNWTVGDFDDSYLRVYGLDYGYFPDPCGGIELSVDAKRKRIFARQHIYATELSTPDLIAQIHDMVDGDRRALIVADTSEPRTTAAIRKAGYNIEKAHKKQITEDIRDLEDWQFIVDPDSYDLIKELNNYRWNDKKNSVPVDDWNHLLDPMRYAWRRVTRRTGGVRRRN